jgi:hypothetical protein
MAASLGHTLMIFHYQTSRGIPDTCCFSYALSMESVTEAVTAQGLVVAAPISLYFNDAGGYSIYGAAAFEEYRLKAATVEIRRLLRQWVDLMARTPHYAVALNNCATVIIRMLRVINFRFAHRPHRWGSEVLADVPLALRHALRAEYDEYSAEERLVTDYFQNFPKRDTIIRHRVESQYHPSRRSMPPPTMRG